MAWFDRSAWAHAGTQIAATARRSPGRVAAGFVAALAAGWLLACAGLFATALPGADGYAQALPSTGARAVVFADFASTAQDLGAIQQAISVTPGVGAFRFVARDEALASLAQRYETMGSRNALADLSANPLPDAFVIDFDPAAASAVVSSAVEAWRRLAHVDAVQADLDGFRTWEAARPALRIAAAAIAAAAAIGIAWCLAWSAASFARLRDDEVVALRLVGADEPLVRAPGRLGGALMLGLAGACALAAASASTEAAIAAVQAAAARWLGIVVGAPWTARDHPAAALAFVVVAALLGAALGSAAAARRARRIRGP